MQKRFEKIKEFMAAGYFEQPDATPFIRYSGAVRRYFEHRKMPEYDGGPLYPCGRFTSDFDFSYHFSFTCNAATANSPEWSRLEKKDKFAVDELKKSVLMYDPKM